MTRRDWWLRIFVLGCAILLHSLLPRYPLTGHASRVFDHGRSYTIRYREAQPASSAEAPSEPRERAMHPWPVSLIVWTTLSITLVYAWRRNWSSHVRSTRIGGRLIVAALYLFCLLVCLAGVLGSLGLPEP
jgi:hypothetical protein